MRGTARWPIGSALILGVVLTLASQKGEAAAEAAPSLLPGSSSKEPINIEADHLEYYQKDGRAIYIGSVVVVQGESSLKCSKLTIFIAKQDKGQPKSATPAPAAAGGLGGNNSVRHMDAEGPVTLASKDQVGTGDRLEYDKPLGKVIITGHVVLTQGTNVTRGDRLVYELADGVARIESGASAARVSGYFLPGSTNVNADGPKEASAAKENKPAKKRSGRSRRSE